MFSVGIVIEGWGKKGIILCSGRSMNKFVIWGSLEKEELLDKFVDLVKNIFRQFFENINQFFLEIYNKVL